MSVAVVTFLVVAVGLAGERLLPGVDGRLVDRAAAARAALAVRGPSDRRPARGRFSLLEGCDLACAVLAAAGGVEMFVVSGRPAARIPQDIADPLVEAVWPIWSGEPCPGGASTSASAGTSTVLSLP